MRLAIKNVNVRRASGGFARDVWTSNARRALGGVWWSHTRWARTQGTMIAKSIAEKQVAREACDGL